MSIIKKIKKVQSIFIMFLLSILLASCLGGTKSQYDECDYGYCGSIQIDTYLISFEKSLSLTEEYAIANNGVILTSIADMGYIIIYFEDGYDKEMLTQYKEEIDKISGIKETHFRMIPSLGG